MTQKFRVYDNVKKKYVEYLNEFFIDSNGSLLHEEKYIKYVPHPHIYTVEYSTGLMDKNGVEIYENDVVVNRELEVASIQWASKDLAFYFCSITSDEFIGFDEINVEEIEIIGNIHNGDENDKI